MRTFEPYTGLRDVAVMHTVVDVAGVNELVDKVYRQAAGYIVGAVRAMHELAPLARSASSAARGRLDEREHHPGVTHAKEALERAGYDLVVFHANGAGGRAMEDLVRASHFDAVLDFTTTELCFQELGGLMDAGPTRMEAAGQMGLPQVLVPGCIDFITTGRYEDAEREFPGRRLYRHNPELTLVRLGATRCGASARYSPARPARHTARWRSAFPRAASRCRTPRGARSGTTRRTSSSSPRSGTGCPRPCMWSWWTRT